MIVAVCADKGSPGVTTLALALGMVWPGPRVVLEADPSGGDLAFWARHGSGNSLLAAEPSVLTLAAAARTGLPPDGFARYAQPTAWGIDLIQGAPGAAAFAPMRTLFPAVATEAARWPGTVIADLGRLQPGSPALPIAQVSAVVLVLARFSVEGLFHVRERVSELAHALGDPASSRNPVAVLVTAAKHDAKEATRQVTRMLAAGGSPIPLAGVMLQDEATVAELRSGAVGKKARGGDLLSSAADIATTIRSWWPELDRAGELGVDAAVLDSLSSTSSGGRR